MSSDRVDVAIIGPGNIGSDLLYKILRRSKYLQAKLMVGIYPQSEGLKRAKSLGIEATAEGIEAIRGKGIRIAFDATSAAAHLRGGNG